MENITLLQNVFLLNIPAIDEKDPNLLIRDTHHFQDLLQRSSPLYVPFVPIETSFGVEYVMAERREEFCFYDHMPRLLSGSRSNGYTIL